MPWLGRWASADPAGMVDGPNRYAYAKNDPIRLHDPTGRATPDERLRRNEAAWRESASETRNERWASWADTQAWVATGRQVVGAAEALATSPIGQNFTAGVTLGLVGDVDIGGAVEQQLDIYDAVGAALYAAVSTPTYHPNQDLGVLHEGTEEQAAEAGVALGEQQYQGELAVVTEVLTLGVGTKAKAGGQLGDIINAKRATQLEEALQPYAQAAKGSTKTDRIKKHILNGELDAARREAAGEVVARKADGTPWDHVTELRDAQRGLVKRIGRIKKELGTNSLGDEARSALEAELSEASRLLDKTEEFLPRE